jgi:hypothetical protein
MGITGSQSSMVLRLGVRSHKDMLLIDGNRILTDGNKTYMIKEAPSDSMEIIVIIIYLIWTCRNK